MRDMFDDALKNEPIDATEAARRSAKPILRRRFYRSVAVLGGPTRYRVLLDERPIRTPAKQWLELPEKGLAELVAGEWEAQTDVIDPSRMPVTRLVNTILDGVVPDPRPVKADIEKFAGSDLLFYRADGPERLVQRQTDIWDPVLEWASETLGARFILSAGVQFVTQPDTALARVRAALPDDAWRLGPLHVMTTLTGSAVLALAVLRRRLSADDAFAAAHLDEDWNMETWGSDDLALQRRAFRLADMRAAAAVLASVPDRAEPLIRSD